MRFLLRKVWTAPRILRTRVHAYRFPVTFLNPHSAASFHFTVLLSTACLRNFRKESQSRDVHCCTSKKVNLLHATRAKPWCFPFSFFVLSFFLSHAVKVSRNIEKQLVLLIRCHLYVASSLSFPSRSSLIVTRRRDKLGSTGIGQRSKRASRINEASVTSLGGFF